MRRLNMGIVILAALILSGAGCVRSNTHGSRTVTQPQELPLDAIQRVPTVDDLREAEQRADVPGPPISELETPSPPNSPWD
ncbi:hypothetical protein HY634_03930 [Candidatus Uhrbacteria bacterium]|nr:hypothetical protein [Candidatus Uhrbacteria bacterium]